MALFIADLLACVGGYFGGAVFRACVLGIVVGWLCVEFAVQCYVSCAWACSSGFRVCCVGGLCVVF